MEKCLFCQLSQTNAPVYSDEHVFVLKDINPQAPVHLLIIPQVHVQNIHELITTGQFQLMQHMLEVVAMQAQQYQLEERGYRLATNCKEESGQTVMHLHMHLIGGKPLQWVH